jgi:hypothetical protein
VYQFEAGVSTKNETVTDSSCDAFCVQSTSKALVEDDTTGLVLVLEGTATPAAVQNFIVTHGMGGTSRGDRFELLARELKAHFPEANVYRIDWTRQSTAVLFGLPNPWAVALRINGVAAVAAEMLRSIGIDPHRTTFIGESFGNYVNYVIARELGGVESIIACNPANEIGGYLPPDLESVSEQSISIISRSEYDTHRKIAKWSVLLETEVDDPLEQHRYGVQWLCNTLRRQDDSWVLLERNFSQADAVHFNGTALPDGSLIDEQPLLEFLPSDAPHLEAAWDVEDLST